MEATRAFAHCNGIRLRYTECGGGPPVVLLHGFPDFSFSWRHQLPALASAGYRCLAVDLRGYNQSDKPKRIGDYAMPELLRDADEFIATVAGGSAHVVGHDWGGIIAWHLAAQRPQRLRRLVILNSPHPARLRAQLRQPAQLLRLWYAGFFQIPVLPELLLSALHFSLLTSAAARSNPEKEIYEEALSQPGALRAALNYYRAAFRDLVRGKSQRVAPITTPTLVLWGEQDKALGAALLDHLEDHVANLKIVRYPDLGHWLHIDAPDRVNHELIDFLNGAS